MGQRAPPRTQRITFRRLYSCACSCRGSPTPSLNLELRLDTRCDVARGIGIKLAHDKIGVTAVFPDCEAQCAAILDAQCGRSTAQLRHANPDRQALVSRIHQLTDGVVV